MRMVRASHDQVLAEMEKVNNHLREEQSKNMRLQNELQNVSSGQRRLIEVGLDLLYFYKIKSSMSYRYSTGYCCFFQLQERIVDLEKECEILKEANEKLVTRYNSVFILKNSPPKA